VKNAQTAFLAAGVIIGGLVGSAHAQTAQAVQAAAFPTGEIVERVECQGFAGQTYALYLPKAYAPTRHWPVIYAFDARENGRGIAELHRAAAERHGWIVVSSNNARSDDRVGNPNVDVMKAMWEDSHARFAIDPRRVYATGYSGGARSAVVLAVVRAGEVAGVIGHGGGYPFGLPPTKPADPAHSFAFYGLAGRRDFNFLELLDLDRRLGELGLSHHFQSFDAPHVWADAAEIELAFRFFEVRARAGTPEAKAAVDDAAPAFVARAEESIALGDRSEGLRILEMLAREFGPSATAEQRADWEARAAALRSSAPMIAEAATVARLQRDEAQREERAKRTLGELLGMDPGTADVAATARKLEIDRLRSQADRSPDRLLRESAARTLASLQGQTGFYMSRELLARGDATRAALLLELSTRVHPDWGWNWAGWAAALAKAGRGREAVAALKRAVELGPVTRDEVAVDPDFAGLRERRDFQAWLAEPAPPTSGAKPGR
jgi:hypothetical protein